MADDYNDNTGWVDIDAYSSGVIETGNDVDFFGVQLVAGQTYTFTVQGNSLVDPYLDLYDPDGDFLLLNDDGGPGLDAQLSFTAPSSGIYYLGASGATASETGSYYVIATVQDDYGSGTGTSGRVSVGGSVTGAIASPDDIDWFKVTLTAGVEYTIRLKGAPSAAGDLEDPFFNGVYDSAGNYIPGTVNDDFGSSSTESKVVFTPATTGSYFLAAAAYSTTLGSYTLSVAGQEVPDLADDTSTTATLALNGTLRSTIGDAGDVDWVKVTLNAGKSYVFELNGDDNAANALADPSLLGIYNAQGALIPNTANDDYGIGLNARVTFAPGASGSYYVAAGAYADTTGGYALKLTSTTTTTDTVGQTTGSAAALSVGSALAGTVDVARDVDWYKVTLSAGQVYEVGVRGVSSGAGTLGDPELIGVYNSAGAIIPGTGNDDAGGTLDAQTLVRITTAGSYYVAVGAADDGTGSFKVAVKAVPAGTDVLDNATTSKSLAVGGSISTGIEQAGDVDWVKVTLTAGTPYQIDQLGAHNGDGTLADPLILGVYNAQGQALASSGNDDGGAGTNARVTLVAPANGSYYVAVGAYEDETGTYKLKLSAAAADTTAPTLQSTSPSDGATAVQAATNLTLEFNEAVAAGSGQIVITGGGSTRNISVSDASQVSFSGSTMTINPASSLAANTDYAVTFAAGVVQDLSGNDHAGITSATQFNFKTAPAGAADTWTIMVYMAADNNLEQFAISDLNEMERVALPGSVNVVTLLDRAAGYDTSNGNWTNTRSGAVVHDNDTASIATPLTSLGELNTGAGQTLTNFINATAASNPASHYALVVWDHGGGLSGTAWDDASNNDNLSLAEMRTAVDNSVVAKFDLIGFDACLQGMVEQAWDLRNLADVVVASQELEPGDGWEYHQFLDDLVANPNLNAFDLASAIVGAYGDRYAGEANTTLSATRSSALTGLRSAIDGFVAEALSVGDSILPQLLDAAERSTSIDGGDHDYRDLGDFMGEIATAVSDSGVKSAAASVVSALDAAMLARVGTVAGANGLSIYLPTGQIQGDYTTQAFQFLQSSSWGNLLRYLTDDQRSDVLGGDSGNNDLRGFDGNDTLTGGSGNDRLDGGSGADHLTGGAGNDRLSGNGGSDRLVLNSLTGSDTLTDFLSGTDKIVISQAALRVGDGDTTIDGARTQSGSGGFARSAELVLITGNIAGSITESTAAARIGSASSAYGVGDTALFMVDNGSSSELYLFTSSAANAGVSAAELTLLATLSATAATVTGDFVFGG